LEIIESILSNTRQAFAADTEIFVQGSYPQGWCHIPSARAPGKARIVARSLGDLKLFVNLQIVDLVQ
jgi:hypothetical protein